MFSDESHASNPSRIAGHCSSVIAYQAESRGPVGSIICLRAIPSNCAPILRSAARRSARGRRAPGPPTAGAARFLVAGGGGTPVEAPELGDLVTYGGDRADHIAFWLGEGRILHATAREGLGVVEEGEPAELRARRRAVIHL